MIQHGFTKNKNEWGLRLRVEVSSFKTMSWHLT